MQIEAIKLEQKELLEELSKFSNFFKKEISKIKL